jgi:hypothetical protein
MSHIDTRASLSSTAPAASNGPGVVPPMARGSSRPPVAIASPCRYGCHYSCGRSWRGQRLVRRLTKLGHESGDDDPRPHGGLYHATSSQARFPTTPQHGVLFRQSRRRFFLRPIKLRPLSSKKEKGNRFARVTVRLKKDLLGVILDGMRRMLVAMVGLGSCHNLSANSLCRPIHTSQICD